MFVMFLGMDLVVGYLLIFAARFCVHFHFPLRAPGGEDSLIPSGVYAFWSTSKILWTVKGKAPRVLLTWPMSQHASCMTFSTCARWVDAEAAPHMQRGTANVICDMLICEYFPVLIWVSIWFPLDGIRVRPGAVPGLCVTRSRRHAFITCFLDTASLGYFL